MVAKQCANDVAEGMALLLTKASMINKAADAENYDDLTVEEMALLVQTDRLHDIEVSMQASISTIKDRQDDIRFLHNLIAEINNLLDSADELSIADNAALQEMLDRARELGVQIDPDKTKWKSAEKDRLIEAIKFMCEDLNSINQMDLQDIQMRMNQRFEIYELTKSIIKPLHEDKITKARKIGTN